MTVARLLREADHDAIHVSERNLLGNADPEVMRVAVNEQRFVITADTDFGELLALGRHPGTSVLLLRRALTDPRRRHSCLSTAWPKSKPTSTSERWSSSHRGGSGFAGSLPSNPLESPVRPVVAASGRFPVVSEGGLKTKLHAASGVPTSGYQPHDRTAALFGCSRRGGTC
jgi:predicted nuclease of predicted toxin-antitoxin system